MYIISRSLSQGKKAGIMSVFGIRSGGLCHTLLAGIGLSAILIASPIAFKTFYELIYIVVTSIIITIIILKLINILFKIGNKIFD